MFFKKQEELQNVRTIHVERILRTTQDFFDEAMGGPLMLQVPASIAEMYENIRNRTIDDWMSREKTHQEQHRYNEAAKFFVRALMNRQIPPEWAQAVVGGYLLEYTETSTIIGYAAVARGLKNSAMVDVLREKLASYTKNR